MAECAAQDSETVAPLTGWVRIVPDGESNDNPSNLVIVIERTP